MNLTVGFWTDISKWILLESLGQKTGNLISYLYICNRYRSCKFHLHYQILSKSNNNRKFTKAVLHLSLKSLIEGKYFDREKSKIYAEARDKIKINRKIIAFS